MNPEPLPELSDQERERYSWQLDVPGHGEEGQRKLKAATVLISRVGGIGGTVALHLAAAGVGRLILAHAGDLRLDDLNRQLLMRSEAIGRPRMEIAGETLRSLNPNVEVTAIPENVSTQNAPGLVALADIVVDAAPLFEERLALNAACVSLRRPMVEAAMHGTEFLVTVFHPEKPGCLACAVPQPPSWWQRRFPVFGAVSGAAASIAALEVIKLITGLGEPLVGRMAVGDLRSGWLRTVELPDSGGCPLCSASLR